MWKNTVQQNSPKMTVWRMSIACWVSKVTLTHSEHTILIAFSLQQLFRESASTLLSHIHISFSFSVYAEPLLIKVSCKLISYSHSTFRSANVKHVTFSDF
jgi:hypothetical protein